MIQYAVTHSCQGILATGTGLNYIQLPRGTVVHFINQTNTEIYKVKYQDNELFIELKHLRIIPRNLPGRY